MGIYDREYIRDDSTGPGLFGGITPVTKSIIVINVIVFLLQNLLQLDSKGITAEWLAASPSQTFDHFRLFQLVTASFVNVGLLSLVFEMYFLWFIGREMEAQYGERDFLAFYLIGAILANLAGLIVMKSAGIDDMIAGPWGAVLAVMTLYTLFYPRQEILFLFFIRMPIWVLLAIFIVMPVLSRFGMQSPGIDLGIVVAAVGYAYCFKHFDLRWSKFFSGRRLRPRLKIFSAPGYEKPARSRGYSPTRTAASVGGGGRSPSVSVLPEDQLDARVDEILAKIAREGNRDSLTDEEQRILQEASRRARIRRSDR